MTEEQSPPPSETAPPPPGPDPILESVDALLRAEDPHFEEALQELGAIKPESADLSDEAIDLEEDLLQQPLDQNGELQKEGEHRKPLVRLKFFVRKKIRGAVRAVLYSWEEYRQLGVSSLKKQGKALVNFAKVLVRTVITKMRELFEFFTLLSWSERLVFFLVLGLAGAVFYSVQFALSNRKLNLLPERYTTSLLKVADRSFEFDAEDPFIDFFSTSNQPQFFVSLDKVVINLRSSENSSPNPMGTFKFYIEGSSQEVAIEIKDREKEIRDLTQRTLEQFTYDQVVTPDGKQHLKIILRQNLNNILNQGRVRRVLLDDIVLKP